MAFVPDKPAASIPAAPNAAPSGSRFVPDVPAPEIDKVMLIPGMPANLPQPAAPVEKSWEQRLSEGIQGAGETLTSLATSVPATVAGSFKGLYKGLTGGKYGTPEGVREAEEEATKFAQEHTYEPRSETGKEYLSKLENFLGETKLAGLPGATGEVAALSRMPAGAVISQAKTAASPVVKAVKQTVGRMSPAARKAASHIIPKPNAQTAALASKAHSLGIPLRPDMLTDNRIVKMIGDVLEKVPLAGAKTEQRRVAFNKAVMREIGADPEATKLTPDVFDKAISTSGKKIGDISARANIPLDSAFVSAIDSHVADAAKFETADVAKVVNNYADELRSKSVNNVIPGEAFRKLNTKIGTQIRSTTNGDLKHALSLLQEDMHDALSRNLSPADRVALADARRKYANAKTLEPLVAKSTEGDISPAGLMGVISATKSQKSALARGRGGELSDIAKVGQRFLTEQPSSGTAERSLGYGILGGGAAMHPLSAASVYALANLYNRLGAAATRKIIK